MERQANTVPLDQVPQGNWVVLSADQTRIISHDPDLQKALALAKERGETDTVFMKAESLGRFLVVHAR